MRTPLHGVPTLLALALALAVGRAEAQSLGFEAGVAGVRNHADPAPSLGVSAFLPLTDRFKGVVSYSHWIGCDGGECDRPRAGYGNQGLNVLGLFRVLGGAHGTNASVGAGAGWYEKIRLEDDGRAESFFQEALTFSTELRVPVAFNSAAYVRGDLSFPDDDTHPRWGFVRVGVDVGRF